MGHKAVLYGCDPQPAAAGHSGLNGTPPEVAPCEAACKVEPALVADVFERWVIPLTKEVQVAYLLRRLDSVPA